MYGERGVGKTSFANIMRIIFQSGTHPIKLTCDTQDTVLSVWKKIFDRIIIKDAEKTTSLGLNREEKTLEKNVSISELFDGEFHRPQDGDPEACLGDESRTGVVRGAAWPPTLILRGAQDKQDLCRCIGNYGNASKQSTPFGSANTIWFGQRNIEDGRLIRRK